MRCAITRQDANIVPTVLNSWKEIASYLGRGVRTVQRWERELHLPVHRIGNGNRSPVFASVTELTFWLHTSEAARKDNHVRATPAPKLVALKGGKPIERSRRLLAEARNLARQIANASVQQRRQAENLEARILEIRAKMR